MENQTFTGIGCFAKPERLGRIFSKLVQNYALGPLKGIKMFDENLSKENEGVDLLPALMAGLTASSGSGDREPLTYRRSKPIIGFYLTLNDQKLKLSVFARGNSTRAEIFTTSLDELTRLRQKRLN